LSKLIVTTLGIATTNWVGGLASLGLLHAPTFDHLLYLIANNIFVLVPPGWSSGRLLKGFLSPALFVISKHFFLLI